RPLRTPLFPYTTLFRSEELQTAVGVLLRDRDHQAQICLRHFAFRAACLRLARGHLLVDVLEVFQGNADPLLDREQLLLLLEDVRSEEHTSELQLLAYLV